MTRFRFAHLLLASASACGPKPAEQTTGKSAPSLDPLGAAEVLRRLEDRYAALEVYEDAGQIVLGSPGKQVDECISFATMFRREHEIRFRFREGCRTPSTVAFDGSGIPTNVEVTETAEAVRTAPLTDAMQQLAGVTYGTSRYVPALFYRYDAFGLKGPSTKVLRSGIVPCGSESCYLVELSITPYQHRELLVDSRFILRGLKDVIRRADGDESHVSVRFTPMQMKP